MPQFQSGESQDNIEIYEAQIRECFAKVVCAHKTQVKCADICLKLLSSIKFVQIILSALTSGSCLAMIFTENNSMAAIIATLFSTILFALNLYIKNYNLGEVAEKHKDTADKLWSIRESYFSLITNIIARTIAIDEIKTRRNQLQERLAAIYVAAPTTNTMAYKIAQASLKRRKNIIFSNNEINDYLPVAMHKHESTEGQTD